jgi:1,4-alpha-glucan branching enzyme
VPPNELIKSLAFVFRTPDGSIVGRSEDGSDIYATIYSSGTYVRAVTPITTQRVVDSGAVVNITAAASSDVVLLQIAANNRELARTTTSDRLTIDYTVTSTTKIDVIGYNRIGGATRDTFTLRVRKKPIVSAVPAGVRDGITITSDSSAIVCVFAPGIKEVFVVGDFSSWRRSDQWYCSITPDGDRWWTTIPLSLSGQTMFQWSMDDDDRMSDPYSVQVSDPNDQYIPAGRFPDLLPYPTGKTTGIVSVINTTLPAYEWKTTSFRRPDPYRMVVYELLVRDFTSSSSFQGVIDSLDYLVQSGVQVIQLLPVQEFEGNDSWGYNTSHLFAVDKYYGSKNDLKRLIDAAHAKGLAVYLDIVLNHQFGQSPLVNMWGSVAGPTSVNPYFNVTARHPFNVGYDMNHEDAATRTYAKRFLQYWITEFKIDGYRFDMSKGLTQTNTGSDVAAWGRYDASRIAILKDYISAIREVDSTFVIIFEHFADNSEEVELAKAGAIMWGNATGAGSNAMQGFDSQDIAGAMSAQRRSMPVHGLIGYVESHDEERMFVRGIAQFDTTTTLRRLEALMAATLCIPGSKMLWQFNELGYPHPINLNGRLGRKPMAWSLLNDSRRVRLRNAIADLSAARQKWPAFATLKATTLSTFDKLKTIVLSDPTCDVILLANLDQSARTVQVPFTRKGVWHEFARDTTWSFYVDPAPSILLMPGEYRIYSTQRLRGSVVSVDEPTVSSFHTSVHPTPASTHVTIADGALVVGTRVQVFTTTGDLHTTLIATSDGQVDADCSTWPSGMYTVFYVTATSTTTHRIVVTH